MTDVTSAFAFLGVLVSLYQLQKLLSLVWFYFLRPTTGYKLYLQGPSPYALITGATDGIGKGIAKDLYCKGFNLILHGRNEEKMLKVIEELRALGGKAMEGSDIRTFIADASKAGHDFEATVKRFEGLNITLVVNNVGGRSPRPTTIDGWGEEEHLDVIRWNALFPTLLTRALLPGLRKTSQQYPVLVTYIGSTAGSTSIPRIPVYSACKAFIYRLSSSLHADERFDSDDSKLSFMLFMVGPVNSNTMNAPVTWMCPAADEFAKMVVNALGCGKQVVVPYIGHVVVEKLLDYLPRGIVTKAYREGIERALEWEAKRV